MSARGELVCLVRCSVLGVVLAALSGSAFGAAEVQFPVSAFQLDGVSLLPLEHIKARLAKYTGPHQQFADLQQAAQTVQQMYAEAGYELTRVSIPPQDIHSAVVTLRVEEVRIGGVFLQDEKHHDRQNILNTLPGLQEGTSPNVTRVGRSLRLVNQGSSKQEQITFRQTTDPLVMDAVVSVADDKTAHYAFTLDNSGSASTGYLRSGIALQQDNVFNRDHLLNAQYVTSLTRPADVSIFGASYRIPIYTLGDALTINGGHSNVNSGTVNTTSGSYGISGSGDSAGVQYSHLLSRYASWDQHLDLAYDYHYFHSSVTSPGSSESLVPDLVDQPLTLTYAGSLRNATQEWGASLSLLQNISGGNLGNAKAYQQSGGRVGARGDFLLWRYHFSLKRNFLNDWQLHLAVDGQASRDALIAGEQFGLGGADSVRGFRERELTDDRGVRGSMEVYGPDIARHWGYAGWHVRPLLFCDGGMLWRNRVQEGEYPHQSIGSAGLGVRVSDEHHLQLRVDYASVFKAGGTEKKGDQMLQAGLSWVY